MEGGILAEDEAERPEVPTDVLSHTVQQIVVAIHCCPACRDTGMRAARSGAVVEMGVKRTRRLLSTAEVMYGCCRAHCSKWEERGR